MDLQAPTMPNPQLVRCFQSVFPDLAESQAERASADRTPGWDSVATVTLVAMVEEEFGCQFQPEDIEHLSSFTAFQEALARKQAAI